MKRWISRRNEARDRRRPGGPPRIEQRSAGAKDQLSGANDFFNGLLVQQEHACGRRRDPEQQAHRAQRADKTRQEVADGPRGAAGGPRWAAHLTSPPAPATRRFLAAGRPCGHAATDTAQGMVEALAPRPRARLANSPSCTPGRDVDLPEAFCDTGRCRWRDVLRRPAARWPTSAARRGTLVAVWGAAERNPYFAADRRSTGRVPNVPDPGGRSVFEYAEPGSSRCSLPAGAMSRGSRRCACPCAAPAAEFLDKMIEARRDRLAPVDDATPARPRGAGPASAALARGADIC
jgi:hypothetical protein